MKGNGIPWRAVARPVPGIVFCLSLAAGGFGGWPALSGQDSAAFSFSLGPAKEMDQSWLPGAGYYPDGGLSVIEIDGPYAVYWPESESSRTVNASPFPEHHRAADLNPAALELGRREPDNGVSNGFNDGGSWLYGVQRLIGPVCAGFIHAESHWYPRNATGWMAYKSIAVAYSIDYGETWGNAAPILTHKRPKPVNPAWTGLGDFCVAYNAAQKAWFCYYSSDGWINAAMSAHPEARPGTWLKYYNKSFSQPGIAGDETPIEGLRNVPGGNPSVHFNSYLDRWVMAYHGWEPQVLYLSTSPDGITWEAPQVLLDSGKKTWYPTVLGDKGTGTGGRDLKLYYAEFDSPNSATRKMMYRTLTLKK